MSALGFVKFCRSHGMALSSLSIYLAMDCCIKFPSLVVRAVIVDSFINHYLPTLQVPRFNTFSFMPSIWCKAFIVKNLSLHSRLFTLGILKSFVVIHPIKTSNFTCKMSLYSLLHQYSPCANCLYVSNNWIKRKLLALTLVNDHWLIAIPFCIYDMLGHLMSPIEFN